MSRSASVTTPGSLLWFAQFEARLAWRDVVAMMTAGRPGRARTLAFGFGTLLIFLHFVAYLVLHFVSDGIRPDVPAFVMVTSGIALSASAMLAQAMETVTRIFYMRSDLELILTAPVEPARLFAVRIAAMALTSAGMSVLVMGPFINMLAGLGVQMVNASAASPYYNPHFQRPAMFPPSDGYQPPEDPLVGCARQINAVREIKKSCPRSIFVGTGYTYFQEYLPNIAQAVIRDNWCDSVGIGRLVLSYWEMPADTLAGRPMQGKRICRTFSDCTTAPRNGIISGCYPLDAHYKDAPEHVGLKTKKMELRKRLSVVQP